MSKRFLSIILVLTLCLAYVPVTAYAATATAITVTDVSQKYLEGGAIFEELTTPTVETDPSISAIYDGWGVEIDGTVVPYPTADQYWEAGHTYYLYIPLGTGDSDSFSEDVICTVNGEAAEVEVDGETGYATIRYPLYVVTDETTDFTEEPSEKTGLTYNGSAQELVNAGSTDDGTIQYMLVSASSAEWSDAIPTGTDVGTYEVRYRIKGDENHFDHDPGNTITVEIGVASATVTADDLTKTAGEDDPELTATVTGVFGSDTIDYDITREEGEDPGTYTITPEGDEEQGNYLVTFRTGTLTIEEEEEPEETSYDFEQPDNGIGSGTRNPDSWTWGERANLPVEVADFYKILVENSVPEGEATPAIPGGKSGHSISNFLAKDETWTLPAADPAGPAYDVDEALICEDHEPEYYANGDGKVDESTFGNSDFYIVGVGTGDTKIDYPNLKTGDVVSNTKFNGVYVTKVQKSSNATYDDDLNKLKSDVIASFRAFELDHPEVFWLNGSIKLRVLTVTISGVQTSYIFMTIVDDSGFTMRITEYAAAGAIENAVRQRDAAVAAILAQIPAGANARQIVTNLNKWFTLHNEYNRSADLSAIGYTPHRSLKALTGNYGTNGPVCDGYSRAVKVICDKLGIPAILDTGNATNNGHSELHMWNRIQVDGVWYGFDCTWDDPIVKGKNGVVSGYENENFLLVGNDTIVNGAKFGSSHPSNKTAGGTTGVLFSTLTVNPEAIEGYLVVPFTDVHLGDWFYDFVKAAYSDGIVGGMTATTYGPSGQLKHGQIMVMVANLHSLQKGDNFKASSVPGDHWAASFRDYCKKEGIIDDRFDKKLDEPVNRGEMAYYFANTLKSSSYKNKKAISLSDIASEPYKAEIERLAKADIVGGYTDGTFKASNLVTRAEAAVFISNIINAIRE